MNMKGLELPINMIVIISIAVVVILAVSMFFLTQSGAGFSTIEATRIWTLGCNTYCNGDGLDGVYNACGSDMIGRGTEFSKDFVRACKTLGYISENNQCVSCLRRCQNECNLDELESSRRSQALENVVSNLKEIA